MSPLPHSVGEGIGGRGETVSTGEEATASGDAFAAFLRTHRERVEGLEVEMGDAWWESNTRGTPEAEERSAHIQKRLTKLYADRDTFAWLRDLDPSPLSPDMARQRKLLLDAYAANQMDDATIEELVDTEKEVESAYNNFRPLLRGERVSDNHLREILRDAEDGALRREAWEASKRIGAEVAERVKRLVALRNREARRLGYADYYAMALSLQELDEGALFALLDDLRRKTDPLWQTYKAALDSALAARFRTTPGALRPWHYPDPFFQEAPAGEVDLDAFFKEQDLEALTAAFYAAIGLPVRDVLGRSDLYEREGKCQHAFCIHVGRFGDVRVLCNCTGSERWMSTLLHEFGHAVYDKYLGSDLPFFLRDTAHTLTTEAIAMLMGRFSRHGAWLQKYAHVPADEAERAGASARREMRAQLLILARWCLVMTHFERALYGDPGQDLNRLWWDMVRRFQGVTPPEGRDEPDWAAKIHLALAPVYYHNYLLGEMFASQLLDYLREKVLPPGSTDADLVQSKAVGAYLKEAIFAQGARLPWDVLVEKATGEPLNPDHFVRQLGR